MVFLDIKILDNHCILTNSTKVHRKNDMLFKIYYKSIYITSMIYAYKNNTYFAH